MHHVLVLSRDLMAGVEGYVATRTGKKYQIIMGKDLKKIKAGDTLYISTHGLYTEDGPAAINEVKLTKKDVNAEQFHDYLKKNSLPNVEMKLKIFACFSAGLTTSDKDLKNLKLDESFAGQVSSLLHRTHDKITVYGYLEQLKFGPVLDGHKSAGSRLDGIGGVRAKDKRYTFTTDGKIIGPDGKALQESRWQ